MIDPLEDVSLHRRADAYIVEQAEMLHVLAQADAACMRADNLAALARHQHHGKHLLWASEAARVNLDDIDGVCLEELLEDDARVGVLARSDTDAKWQQRFPDGGVAQSIVGRGGLLNEPWLEGGELRDVVDGF